MISEPTVLDPTSVRSGVVVPDQRIKELQSFYIKRDVITIEDGLLAKDKINDETQGKWATNKFAEAASEMFLAEFVTIPLNQGGYEIPTVPRKEDYINAHQIINGDALNTEKTFVRRTKYIEMRDRELAQLERQIATETSVRLEDPESATTAEERSSRMARFEEWNTKITDLQERHNKKYLEWASEHRSLKADTDKICEAKAKAIALGSKQFDQDTDAKNNLSIQMTRLKNYLAGLVKKCPAIRTTVHLQTNGRVPYDENNLRLVYENLRQRYRANDQIGIAVALVNGMRIEQGKNTLAELIQEIGIFRQDMGQLGVTKITMDDYAALCAIKAMTQQRREQFLRQAKTLELTDPDSDGEDNEFNLDDQSTIHTKRSRSGKSVHPKSLMANIERWIAMETDLTQLDGGFTIETKPKQVINNKDEQKRIQKEAQQVYTTAAKNSKECFAYANTGVCPFGENCKYTHTSAESVKPKTICGRWEKTGTCSFGSRCFHASTHTSNPGTKTTAKTTTRAEVNSTTTKPLQKGVDYDMDVEVLDVVIVEPEEVINHVHTHERIELMWDTAASISVVNNLKLLDNPQELTRIAEARGVGGIRKITHEGYSSVFDMKMSYLDGATTPNLKSIGRTLEEGGGCVLFTSEGAVQFKNDKWILEQTKLLTKKAQERNLVVSTAQMRNYVYVQEIEKSQAGLRDKTETVAWTSSEGKEFAAEIYAVNVNLFAGRIKLDSVNNLIHMLVASGLTEAALKAAVKNKIIAGIPDTITMERIKTYFKEIGKDTHQLEADMTTAVLRVPIDYEIENTVIPGECIQMDALDPPFSRIPIYNTDSLGHRHRLMKHIPAIGGYVDAVLCIDEASGYAFIFGRENKKNPHLIVEREASRWMGHWKKLKYIKADKEFVTKESKNVLLKTGVRLRQGTPGDHRRIVNKVEGATRWIQDLAQANMNRLRPLIEEKVITAEQACSFWLLALNHAVMAWNMRPSFVNPLKSRFEEGTGDAANLSYQVMMPFGMRVVGRNLRNDADGRGSNCLYVGPSPSNRAGIITYCLKTGRLQVKYSFKPVQNVARPDRNMERAARRELYGNIRTNAPVADDIVPTNIQPAEEQTQNVPATNTETPLLVEVQAEVPTEDIVDPGVPDVAPTTIDHNENGWTTVKGKDYRKLKRATRRELCKNCVVDKKIPSSSKPNTPVAMSGPAIAVPASATPGESATDTSLVKKKKIPVVSNYGTRSRGLEFVLACMMSANGMDEEEYTVNVVESVLATDTQLPPKPTVPSNRACRDDPKWIAADLREAAKLNEEDVFHPLPIGANGKEILPPDAIVLRLLRRREYKRKVDPNSKTGETVWLECCRFVCDGSVDKREGHFYAETPDRALLMLMISIGASKGERTSGSDVERAYLNAQSIDRNIVIEAPSDMQGVPRMSLLNKGLYGSRGGALSWEKYINEIMKNLKYTKNDIARGTYQKELDSGEVLRSYRHSDDFLMSSNDSQGMQHEEQHMRDSIRMAPFTPVKRFLGCTFERINYDTGEEDETGTVVLVRQSDKIAEMHGKYKYLHTKYNPKDKIRQAALPTDAMQEEDKIPDAMRVLLSSNEIREYQGVCGSIGWIVGCTRPDAKFAYFLLATRLSKPRQWDFHLATWVMDYLMGTSDVPLVLGGPVIDPEATADASFAILNAKENGERRSVVGHVVVTGKGSGAIIAQVGATKCAVGSIWEAELIAGLEASHSAIFCTNVCKELKYPVSSCRTVYVDNQAEIDWIRGDVSTKRSRHVDVKMYYMRHMNEDNQIKVEYVATEENMADILTKPLPAPLFRRLAAKILGHDLLKNSTWFP